MKNLFIKILLLSVFIALCSFGFRSDTRNGKTNRLMKLSKTSSTTVNVKSGKVGDAYAFRANNLNIPIDNKGILGDVSIDGLTRGEYDGEGFLFSGGFMISGLVDTGSPGNIGQKLWASAMASASRIEDYVPGPWGRENDPDAQVYVVQRTDDEFGQSWTDWVDAVVLGADFYDGDNDGIYNPVDKNGNGKWDSDEDKPDMPGDVTAWCVYSDGRPTAQRGLTGQIPQGIEIRQTLFAFDAAGTLGNMVFLRYRVLSRDTINYSGNMDSVYFGVWADPDIGEYTDDMVGCDTVRSAGYGFNDGSDTRYGVNPPCYMVDFFQGPVVYQPGVTFTDVNTNGVYDSGIDVPLMTAIEVFGIEKGMRTYPGARNLGLSSFVNYVQSDPNRGDPNLASEARGYMMGLERDGSVNDPCADTYGSVVTGDCNLVNNKFWYSGDPITGTGWLYNTPKDIRIMSNVGPFKLEKNKPVDIVVALIVGRGSDAKNSITIARSYSDIAQVIYNGNFRTPPPPPPVDPITIRTTEKEIYLTWETKKQVNFINQAYTDSTRTTLVWDMRFEGYEVTAFRNPVTATEISGIANSKVIARYDIANKISGVFIEDLDGARTKIYNPGIQLDTNIYKTDNGRITVKIDADPFDETPLIKGKAYYFAITGHALNYVDIKAPNIWLDTTGYYRDTTANSGDYLFPRSALFTTTANNPNIITWGNPEEIGIRPGVNIYDPVQMAAANPGQSAGDVYVTFEEVYKDQLTGDTYAVNFFQDSASTTYKMMWRLTNKTTNTMLLDSQRVYNLDRYSDPSLAYTNVAEGVRVKVDSVDPALKTPIYVGQKWYEDFVPGRTGVMYMSNDLPQKVLPSPLNFNYSRVTRVPDLRQVEVRFGPTQKAYRYVFNSFATRSYYAPFHATSSRRGPGYVDVPFQIWEKDARFGTERQLAVAFFETYAGQNGIWNPGTDISTSKEYILVLNSPYTADSLVRYTGGSFNGDSVAADLRTGWTKPASWTNMTTQDSIIARSPMFDVLYAVGFERAIDFGDTLFYQPGEVLTIPVAYPILSTDEFTFTTRKLGEGLTEAEKRAMWNRVTVYPNPLFAYNPGGSFIGRATDEPYVTFSNLPRIVTVRIFTLSGSLIRTLTQEDKRAGIDWPFLEWDLENSNGLRVASGMYIALVSSPGLGEKVLKLAIIMPQKQIQNY